MRAVAAAAAGVIGARTRAQLRIVLEAACRKVLSFDAFFILGYDPATHTFTGFGGTDAGIESPPSRVNASGTPGEHVVRERRTIVTHRADEPGADGAALTGTGRRSQSVIRSPVLRGEQVLGIFSVQSYQPDLYTPEDVEVVEAIAALAATAMVNIQLSEERTRAQAELQSAYAGMERRVVERTAELARANEALRRANEEAEQAREAAETANRAKSDFLSRMSHELRTPMNSILGFGQLLARRDVPADQRRAIEHILKAGQHLLLLINEVLDLSRIEANRQDLCLEPVHLDTALREAINLVRPLAQENRCVIADDPAVDAAIDDSVWVRADRQRLAQVLLNLLSNALKYNRAGGRVWITCDAPVPERVRIGVHDTGPGIPEHRMNELFVPFSRLGADQSGVVGTGLGLALSRLLAEAMGGSLSAESVWHEGSTFWLELMRAPAASPHSPAIARKEAAQEGQPRPATVLCIEDNVDNLSLIEAVLELRPGITMLSAVQGRMGLDLALQHEPDLLLLDVNLPDLGGLDVLRRLRSDRRTHAMPVIVISADANPEGIRALMDAGARAYVTKPIDVEELLGAVDDALAHRGD